MASVSTPCLPRALPLSLSAGCLTSSLGSARPTYRSPSHCFHFPPRLSPGSPFLSVAPFFFLLHSSFLCLTPFSPKLRPPFSRPRSPLSSAGPHHFPSDPTSLFFRTPPLRLCLPSSGPRTEDGKGVGAVSRIGLRTGGGEASPAIHFSGMSVRLRSIEAAAVSLLLSIWRSLGARVHLSPSPSSCYALSFGG